MDVERQGRRRAARARSTRFGRSLRLCTTLSPRGEGARRPHGFGYARPHGSKKKTPAKKKPALKKKSAAKTGEVREEDRPARKTASKSKGGKRPAPHLQASFAQPQGGRQEGRREKAGRPAHKAPKAKVAEAPEALALARDIARVAQEKKAEGVTLIDTRVRSSAVGYDYVVLATGESDRQLSAIQEGVDELLKPRGKRAATVEASADWVCVTYDEGVVAHFFTPDRRDQMDLECKQVLAVAEWKIAVGKESFATLSKDRGKLSKEPSVL